MQINYDKIKLNTALKDFFHATGICLNLLDKDYTIISEALEKKQYCKAVQSTKMGKFACRCSDTALLKKCSESRKPEIHTCHAGLSDIAVPIIVEGEIAGYIIMGQMKIEEDFSKIFKKIKNFNLDFEKMKEYYTKIPFYDESRIESISRLALMLATYILTEDMLKPAINRNADIAAKFIANNLSGKLSSDIIAKKCNMSVSSLYSCFHSCFNCTVSEYIIQKRIEKAALLLTSSDYSVEEISHMTGFSSAAYFTKNFKKIKGTTPLKFKKSCSL
ncbi:MAG: PocR ligand-binding domain-containing protein [Clostridia bacterium]|nr:PocR ligand-binding domain-containing protein [Clostridia bacterium]